MNCNWERYFLKGDISSVSPLLGRICEKKEHNQSANQNESTKKSMMFRVLNSW